jgi:hypothetical protein
MARDLRDDIEGLYAELRAWHAEALKIGDEGGKGKALADDIKAYGSKFRAGLGKHVKDSWTAF